MKIIIAGNIAELRKKAGMTQLELAEKLNYSDKAISKWERGESIPDVTVLKNIAELFGVTVDYLLTRQSEETTHTEADKTDKRRRSSPFAFLISMCILLVWLIAAGAFVIMYGALRLGIGYSLIAFFVAVPISCTVWLVLNSVWFHGKRNYTIISALMWTLIAAIQLTFLAFGKHTEIIYLLGIPGQAIIISWDMFSRRRKFHK